MAIMKEKFLKNKNPRDAILMQEPTLGQEIMIRQKSGLLKANSLNNSLEESWILFAKSETDARRE